MEKYNKKEAEKDTARKKKGIEIKKKEALQLLMQENPRWRLGRMRLINCLLEEGIEYQTEIANQVLSETNELRKSRLLSVFAVQMLVTNYQKKDAEILMEALRKIPVNFHSQINYWHGVYSMVFDLFDNRQVKNPPKEILYFLYENTMCGFCRECYVREMKRRHILTEEMIRECKWDSNDDIREIVL